MNTINIIGLGVGKLEDLSVKSYNQLTDGTPIFLRTNHHPIADDLSKNVIEFGSFDNYFENIEDFSVIYTKIVEKIVALAKKYGKINYCVPGSPFVGDTVTKELQKNYSDEFDIKIFDAPGFTDECLKLANSENYNSIKIIDSSATDDFCFDVNSLNIITQIESKAIASDVKIKLMEVYPEEQHALLIDVLNKRVIKMPIYSLDQENNYEFSTYFCILPIETCEEPLYNINNLCRIVRILRGPEGCPWDIEQTHDSSKKCVTDEAQEVVEAIEHEDYDNLCEELGDLLFQVIFHSELASEEGYFNINDVINGVCKKMIRRHPHVFGNDKAYTYEEALSIWNNEKRKEKSINDKQ